MAYKGSYTVFQDTLMVYTDMHTYFSVQPSSHRWAYGTVGLQTEVSRDCIYCPACPPPSLMAHLIKNQISLQFVHVICHQVKSLGE